MTRIVIIGGGPAGYEAALVAAQLGAEVTVIERDGIGRRQRPHRLRPVEDPHRRRRHHDVRPRLRRPRPAGRGAGHRPASTSPRSTTGSRAWRWPSPPTSTSGSLREGVRIIAGHRPALRRDPRPGRRTASRSLDAEGAATEELESDVVLIATGADPRVLPGAEPDGERILDWRDVYELEEMPEHLVVVGSGVTGAEFASGYLEAGVPVTLVSSRDQVLPGEDSDAAAVVEKVFHRPRRPDRRARPRRERDAHREGRARRAHRRPHRRGLARADDRRHRAEHRRAQPRAVRRGRRPSPGTSSSTASPGRRCRASTPPAT